MHVSETFRAGPYRILSLLVGIFTVVGSCAKSTTQPTTGLMVTAISPAVGSTGGGTNVTITGNDFANDATVTVAGVPTTNVVFQSSTALTAITGAGPAGTGDVVVTSGGRTATLANGFGFVAPTGGNLPPVIVNLRSIGSHPGQPSGFADQDETVTLVADATDAETPASS